ncbi:hypothetical protein BU15DRAFT_68003 [Melanogaster broomeanus]|nr:hypothetical protein BU15DRAFT_68003 [Melanogaster broomeanus]
MYQRPNQLNWLMVFKFIDEHPGIAQDAVVQHFKTLPDSHALIFDQLTLSQKIRDHQKLEPCAHDYPNTLSSKHVHAVTSPLATGHSIQHWTWLNTCNSSGLSAKAGAGNVEAADIAQGFVMAQISGRSLLAVCFFGGSVTHFGDLSSEDITQIPTGFIWAIVLTEIMASLVQCTISVTGVPCKSCPCLLKKLYIPVFCWFMSALRFAGSLYITVGTLRAQNLSEFFQSNDWLLVPILIGGACLDIIIAASMCYYLKRQKVFAIARTAKMLDKLMVYSIGSTFQIRSSPCSCPFRKVVYLFARVTTEADTADSVAITMLVSLNLRRVHSDECEAVIYLPQANAADGTSPPVKTHLYML